MNRNMLDRELAISKELDRYIAWWQRERGEKPKQVTVTRKQMQMLEDHACDGADLSTWDGVPLKVQSE